MTAGPLVRAILTLTVVGVFAVPVAAQDEIVVRGNQAYQDEDYAGAIEAYQAVLDAGFRSAGLEYNLGNAYFKSGRLGRAILHWERALEASPGDPDIQANLELARSLTVDAVDPLPTFWGAAVVRWWVRLLPRPWLIAALGLAWLVLTGGVVAGIVSRSAGAAGAARWLVVAGVSVLVLFGPSLLVRETGFGLPERGIILAEAVAVRSAPAADDDLTLFEIHEGTRVRIDQRAGAWLEIVLDDGKVGWVPADVLVVI